jgi:hypothetical protein
LRGGSEEKASWICDQGTEVSTCSYAKENERRIDAERRPLIEIVQKPSRLIS